MFEPECFGLSPSATLAHVADPTPSRFHVPFWNGWTKAIAADDARLTAWTSRDLDPADATATHQVVSHRHVRLGCRLIEPAGAHKPGMVRSGVVVLHGYERPIPLAQEDDVWAPLISRGVAVLALRIRGFAGSLVDTGDWSSPSWICRGLDVPVTSTRPEGGDSTCTDLMAWSLPLGIADVVNACRALARHLGPGVPISLSGESFGGALASIAAGLFATHPELGVEIARLQIALPTFGDWKWRLASERLTRAGGSQREVRDLLVQEASRADELVERLRICDTAVHAQRIKCPVLCKLALRDEVVPAPSAAAVYNALYSPPGRKWRFVTPYGHFDGGIRNARRHALFDRCTIDFLDPGAEPIDSMVRWQPLLASGERAS